MCVSRSPNKSSPVWLLWFAGWDGRGWWSRTSRLLLGPVFCPSAWCMNRGALCCRGWNKGDLDGRHSAQHIHYPLPVSYTHLTVYLGTFYGGSTDVFIMCENSHELVPGGNQTYLQLLGQRRLVLLTLMLLLLLFVGSTSLPVAPKREIPEENVHSLFDKFCGPCFIKIRTWIVRSSSSRSPIIDIICVTLVGSLT